MFSFIKLYVKILIRSENFMRDYYFNNLKKEEKKKVIQEYKKE